MNIRKFHRTVGCIFAPFFLMTATTGIILLWRKAGLYSKETTGLLLGLHNWELVAKYIGVILAFSLITMASTGLSMLLQQWNRKRSINKQ
jgi:uncharacterized iron-regulated membrane protein